jgi:hypothetical protein
VDGRHYLKISLKIDTALWESSNLVEDSESGDYEVVSQGGNNEARGSIIVRPPLRAAEGKSGRI